MLSWALIAVVSTAVKCVESSVASKYLYNATQTVDNQTINSPHPYEFPWFQNGSRANSGQFPMPKCYGFQLEEATIDQVQPAMSKGTLTAVQIVSCYLKRTQQVDEYIRSVMEINPDVLEIAAAMDQERRGGHVRSPLHGIPFLVKDNIATKDKMETTAGSWMLLGSVVPRDAHVVHRLRESGAILMGHATMSEWADMRSNSYSEGYSARGGQCRSPYNLTANPGGSSSGSGAAVAANIGMFALGTETDGSVISPAERNAVVGIKPTVGLTSRTGVIPESHTQDTVGCFARTVRDATYCLGVIYGPDPRDNYTLVQQAPSGGFSQYLTSSSSLANMTFGLPWLTFWQFAPPSQHPPLLALLNQLEAAGATVVNNTELPTRNLVVSPDGWDWDFGSTRGYPNESEYTVVKADFYNDIHTYLSELNNTAIRTFSDILAYNIANAGSEGGLPSVHPAFASGQDGFDASSAWAGATNETYWQARGSMQKATREDGIDAALFNGGMELTALLVPSDVGQVTNVAAQAGYPLLTLPVDVGAETGMPFGLGVMGTAWSEGVLVRVASAVEDLQMRVNGKAGGRTRPEWWEFRARNVPVNNV